MAFSTDYGAKFTALIFIILCTKTHISASEDDIYSVEVDGRQSQFHDISVIDFKHTRLRRDTGDSSNGTGTTENPKPPTTPPNLAEMNIIHDDHSYYTSVTFKPADINSYWVELQDVKGHTTLSDSHRTAVTAKLPFRFPFYGHMIDNVTIATGGFLYMSPFIHKFLTATQYIAPLMANFDTKSGGRKSTVIYKTVGFLYMSPFLHQWLTATQYIAPLMANFDTRVGNASAIYYGHVDEKFVVEWRDVHLQDQNGRSTEGTGAFKFQAILHVNGSISFIYKQLPIPIVNISSTAHPVKIGLSDAFYFDTTAFGTKRRTIYEYHRVVLNTTFIEEGTIVLMNPQPTCNRYTECDECVSANIDFECKWCGIVKKCSDSVDWHRQEWLNAGCVHLSSADNDTCYLSTTTPTTANNLTTSMVATTTTGSKLTSTPPSSIPHIISIRPCINSSGSSNCSSIPTAKPPTAQKSEKESADKMNSQSKSVGSQIGVIVVVVVIVVVLIGAVSGWFYYAYSHPTSASGMWLMEHRPSQMKAKMSNMKFWKRNGTAGDKYAVESTA